MLKAALSFLTGGTAVWYIVGALALACAGSGWLLYDAIEDKGVLRAEVASKQREIDRLADAVRASEKEAAIQRSINSAGENVVGAVQTSRDSLRGRVATIVREIVREPDCNDPVGPVLRLAFDRLRVLDREDRDRRREGDRGVGPAGPAAAAPAAPRSALTYCQAGEFIVDLFEYALGRDAQILGIGRWVDEAKAIRAR